MKAIEKLSVLFIVLVVSIAYSKDDPTSAENRPPEAFQVAATPTQNTILLQWRGVSDPDGDKVSYSIELEGEILIENNIANSYTIENLDYQTTYSGRVIATDQRGGSRSASYTATTGESLNTAPEMFALLSPTNGITKLDRQPQFSWEPAVDPDGDAITYDLYLDTSEEPTILVVTEYADTQISSATDLDANTMYYWKVVAKDGKGGETQSAVFSFTTDYEGRAVKVTENAQFPGRYEHTTVVFDSKMWVIGGTLGNGTHYDDVWYSENGENWNESPRLGPWFSARRAHASVVFDNKIWVIGGFNGTTEFNDIWYSQDGENWTQATANAAFEPRYAHKVVEFNGKLWLFGGRDKNTPSAFSSRDLWSSTDGISWTKETDDVGFDIRAGFQIEVFENAMWKIGWQDVFFSTNGIDWTTATIQAEYGNRNHPASVVFDGAMYILGGGDGDNPSVTGLADVWHSEDGASWSKLELSLNFNARARSTSLVFQDKIWIIGGDTGALGDNDVWYIEFN